VGITIEGSDLRPEDIEALTARQPSPPDEPETAPGKTQTKAVPAPVPMVHDVVVVTTKKYSCAKVMGVPPEEFGIEKAARTIADCNYAYHDIVTKTEGALIAEGFDEEQVRALPGYSGATDTETLARDTAAEHESGLNNLNRSSRIVQITEHYIRMDYEGNGKPGLYMVITGGGSAQGDVLRKTIDKDGKETTEDCIYPIDAIPFAAATPVPVTHRFIGRSLADLVMDIQRIKTAILRGGLDNTYLHNAPRPVVSEAHSGPNTIDDILTVRQGAPIRMKMPGGIEWQTVPDITGSIFPMLQYIDSIREARTGMSQQSQGLDANALQNQSATAVNQVFSASQMRMKLIARILAEGVKDIFSLLHATIRKHGQQAQTVRLRNSWVNVDPRQWKTRNDMTIHVGLGTGNKAQQYTQMMGIANVQKEFLLGGKGHLVPDAQLFNTAAELVKLTGHKNPDKFFADPSAKDPKTGQLLNPPQPPPPPEAVQVAQVKAQTDQQQLGIQAQLDERADQRKAQIEATQAQADIATQDRKTQAEMVQSEREFELKRELAVLEFQLQRQLETEKLNMQREMHQQQMAQSAEQHRQQMEAGVFKVAQGQQAHEQKIEQMKSAPQPKGNGK